MPSPRFGAPGTIVDCVALAVRDAWAAAPDQRTRALTLALRRQLGNVVPERVVQAAMLLLDAQPKAPKSDVEPVFGQQITLCTRCRAVKLTEERALPYSVGNSHAYLRDPKWMRRQVEVLHQGDAEIAKVLGCVLQTVRMWRNRHGIPPGKSTAPHLQESWLRKKLIDERLAPGEVAELAGVEPEAIRQLARDRGIRLAAPRTGERGHPDIGAWAHHYREWWVERLERDPQPTQHALAKMAGIKSHAVLWHLRKHDLFNPDRASKKRKPKHAQLYVPGWLEAQLQTKTKVQIAREVGCEESNVAYAERKMRLADTSRPAPAAGLAGMPWNHDPEWWRSRFPAKPSIEDLAAEAGVKVKTCYTLMSKHGVLREYHNLVGRWSDGELQKTRRKVLARSQRQLTSSPGAGHDPE